MTNQTLTKELKSSVLIRFQDCDPFAHLNNSKYIDYFMNAREDQIRNHYDLDIFALARTEQKNWIVVQNQISYMVPATVMEKVVIRSRLIAYSKKSLTVELEMLNHDETQHKAYMFSKFVHVDLKTQRSIEHSNELMKLFEEIYYPVPETHFDLRLREITSMQKSLT